MTNQILGIHGYPVAPWDGVVGNGPGIGYCMHNSVLFPTWHRPYLALLDVRLEFPAIDNPLIAIAIDFSTCTDHCEELSNSTARSISRCCSKNPHTLLGLGFSSRFTYGGYIAYYSDQYSIRLYRSSESVVCLQLPSR